MTAPGVKMTRAQYDLLTYLENGPLASARGTLQTTLTREGLPKNVTDQAASAGWVKVFGKSRAAIVQITNEGRDAREAAARAAQS
jgi:hypothetical protein